MLLPFYSLYLSVILFLSFAIATTPWPMSWSLETFGPDGPWHALSIPIGWPNEQIVALYPGGAFQSHIISTDICDSSENFTRCLANPAGLYNITTAAIAGTAMENAENGFRTKTDFTGGGLNITGTQPISFADNVDIGGKIIGNVSMALQSDGNITYPDGSQYPLTIGTFALGGPGQTTQSFGDFVAQLVPGFLSTEASSDIAIPSNSYGLHIGSASLGISPSLYFGGFDQTRLLGNVSMQTGSSLENADAASELLIDLIDISLTVGDGPSPWTFDSMDGLLASGNDSIRSALQVDIRSVSPYFNLPESTCGAIAAQLPVTYQPNLGLYFWNINDSFYTKIVLSPATLSFTFRKDQLNNENITINVPFMLLNLDLESPLVDTTTKYFPCNAQSRGNYQLGRAFLQAAFVGVNWHIDNNVATWWLGQAPGPNTPSQAVVQSIADSDTTINASTNSWVESWSGSWKLLMSKNSALNDSPANVTAAISLATSTPKTSTNTHIKKASSSLSSGAKAGIGIGCTLIIIAAIAGGIFLMRRGKSKEVQISPTMWMNTPDSKTELDSLPIKSLPKYEVNELGSGGFIAELSTGDESWQISRTSHRY